jgi:demethylmenaquinone methyltransferase/2-methoxy-6-polyprenyl-1,4-benzoquinol methylase
MSADGSGAMFDRIADRYDLVNSLASFGLHGPWRRALVRALGPIDGLVVDVATGTADVALALARANPPARVLGIDPSSGMLAEGRRKVAGAGLDDRIDLREGVAERLPVATGAAAACTCAFGIRNVGDRGAALAEMARITRAGGLVAILELGMPARGPAAVLARMHVRSIVPRLGGLFADPAAYDYLQRSIAAFPEPEAFAAHMAEAGLEPAAVRTFAFGAAHLYLGRRSGSSTSRGSAQ